ncbi:major facilitator superfamily domain-containing protein 6 [Nephila pilipes]|uniref:Major facilitator superfamily domain-containing protein 6 n=1 Tax=Nephila pilipes TaxID=299642 RepID=A0A8X6UD72_NEPPI|nr:major facilitator superfamily domain-containing protein 6 [Nephila pilipes]
MAHQKDRIDKSIFTTSLEQSVDKTTREKWWKINKDMIRIKLHFFLLTGALGSVNPFLVVLAKNRLGLSATSFATTMVFTQFLAVVARPVIGFITDYINKLKLVLFVLVVFQVNNSSIGLLVENNVQEASSGNRSDFQTYQFWAFLVVFALFCTSKSSTFTLSDTACCECVQKKGADFGKQRLYGAVGWGLFAPIAGYLNDYTNDYLAAWIIFTVLSLIMLWNISQMDLVKPQSSKTLFKDIRTILKSKQFLFYEVGVLVTGIGIGFVYSYVGWFVISIGGNRLICGFVETIQCLVGEIPFMFFSGWILKKIGYFNVTTIALLSHCIRFLWYSQLQNPWMILPIEWTHGISYGLFYTSIASYAKKSATPGAEATIQSVVASTYEGLGKMLMCLYF